VWYLVNFDPQNLMKTPYAFPTLALSTLHALPTPVSRVGQKVCKPAWFDIRARESEAWNAVGDVASWLAWGKASGIGHSGDDGSEKPQGFSRGHWTHTTIATELGGWLRAVEQCAPLTRNEHAPPSRHKLFSSLPWTAGLPAVADNVLLEHGDTEVDCVLEEEDTRSLGSLNMEEDGVACWWMAVDDIEEVN